jgi:hypothetical protein
MRRDDEMQLMGGRGVRDGGRRNHDAARSAMREVKRRFSGERIGYRRIGAGLAKGDWGRLSGIIEEELAGEDHALVEYEPWA